MSHSDFTYKEQLDVLRNLHIRDGEDRRMDCPFCGGKNTFGVSRHHGLMKWGCFRVSCKVTGVFEYEQTAESIRQRLKDGIRIVESDVPPIPNPLVSIGNNHDICDWLYTYNSLEAYERKLVDITYSPTEDRVMFKIPKHNGYTGRNVEGRKPKWKKYGDTSHVFTCGTGETGVLVEDTLSACAVGVCEGYTGVSILGTTLTTQHKLDLHCFKRVLVCLDPDAALTGLNMVRKLDGITTASLRIIPDDLKYYDPDSIMDILESKNDANTISN